MDFITDVLTAIFILGNAVVFGAWAASRKGAAKGIVRTGSAAQFIAAAALLVINLVDGGSIGGIREVVFIALWVVVGLLGWIRPGAAKGVWWTVLGLAAAANLVLALFW